jgi:Rhodopirellula transposase DDE domain
MAPVPKRWSKSTVAPPTAIEVGGSLRVDWSMITDFLSLDNETPAEQDAAGWAPRRAPAPGPGAICVGSGRPGGEHKPDQLITQNWRGKPLISHQVIIQLIAATTTNRKRSVWSDSFPMGP